MTIQKARLNEKQLGFVNEISGTAYAFLVEPFNYGDKEHYIEITNKVVEYLFVFYFDTIGDVKSETDVLSYKDFLLSNRKDAVCIKEEIFQISSEDSKHLFELAEKEHFLPTATDTKKTLSILYKVLKNCFENEKHQTLRVSFDAFLLALDANAIQEDAPIKALSNGKSKINPSIIEKKTINETISKRRDFSDLKALFDSENDEVIKGINLFTDEMNRKNLIDYLDDINKFPNAKEKELRFLRFLVRAYKDTEYSIILEQILLFACYARCNNPTTGKYNEGFDSSYNMRQSGGAIRICPHIKHIDSKILDFSMFRVPEELIDEEVQPRQYDIEFQLNQVDSKYQSINTKSKAKWILKTVLSLCIFVEIAMIIIGSNMLRPSGEPVSVGGNLLIIFGIPTALVGLASLIMAIGTYSDIKYKHAGNDFLNKDGLCYEVLAMKMAIVYGIYPKTELKFTNDRYSEPFNCKLHKVKSSSDS